VVYLIGGLIALGGFWFWIRGTWYAALIAALFLGGFHYVWYQDPHMTPTAFAAVVCFVVPWVPLALRLVVQQMNAVTDRAPLSQAPTGSVLSLRSSQDRD